METRVEGDLIIVEIAGEVSQRAMDEAWETVMKIPGYRDMHRLWDYRTASIMMTVAELRDQGMKAGRLFAGEGRNAIVVPGDLVYGLCRIYEAYRSADEDNRGVFRDLDEALEFLRR